MAKQRVPTGRSFPSLEEIVSNPLPKIASKKGGKVTTILALDLSTSCVGWALGMDRKLMLYGKFVFTDGRGDGDCLMCFRDFLEVVFDVYEPDRILVEKPWKTAGHFELLGVVREIAKRKLDLELLPSWIISARTIKRIMRVQAKSEYKERKKAMVKLINSLYGLKLKYAENSKFVSDDDIADAIAVLTAYWRRGEK